ncbi:hypothetical protein [Gordonia shandongensis]|uniref:hypothetical protein n=1 Tax=Gordonia shandongensis TaxID=376351 RepID=UPI00041F4816|nr:hypothetical protein [Gordonia shandongensis]
MRPASWLVVLGVLVLIVTGFFYDALSPWAYLNAVAGTGLVLFARRRRLPGWWAIAAMPLWQTFEVSLYYPWADPGIPISLFLNPVIGGAALLVFVIHHIRDI